MYRSMIESLQYLTAIRPYICQAASVCAQYQVKPKISHMTAIRKILKYVNATTNLGLYYIKDTTGSLMGYCTADWAGSLEDGRSTNGGCFFIGNNMVSWHNKKHNDLALSTPEAELIALESCCTQLM
ncbi:putative RNA-directed DNA polymerase [Arabidopsis thaliana]